MISIAFLITLSFSTKKESYTSPLQIEIDKIINSIEISKTYQENLKKKSLDNKYKLNSTETANKIAKAAQAPQGYSKNQINKEMMGFYNISDQKFANLYSKNYKNDTAVNFTDLAVLGLFGENGYLGHGSYYKKSYLNDSKRYTKKHKRHKKK
ncbi:hypothetical protein GVAV_001740 [Gurleya vavrai]